MRSCRGAADTRVGPYVQLVPHSSARRYLRQPLHLTPPLALPVLILSGRNRPEEKVRGLDLGADDYLVKPFSLDELRARVRALLRRPRIGGAPQIHYGDLVFDTIARTATADGRRVDLSAREVGVLEVLLSRFGKLVSKEELLGRLYGFDKEAGYNAIEAYIHRRRKKLEGAGITVHGRGYMLEREY